MMMIGTTNQTREFQVFPTKTFHSTNQVNSTRFLTRNNQKKVAPMTNQPQDWTGLDWTRFPGGAKPEGGEDDEDSPFDKPGDVCSIPHHVTAFHDDNQQEGGSHWKVIGTDNNH
jgi:hypothetical protein